MEGNITEAHDEHESRMDAESLCETADTGNTGSYIVAEGCGAPWWLPWATLFASAKRHMQDRHVGMVAIALGFGGVDVT